MCNYKHDLYNDFDWTHINTKEVPHVSPDLPQGDFLSFLTSSQVQFMVAIYEIPIHRKLKDGILNCLFFPLIL